MSVSRGQIIARGLSNRCPNCGQHSLFPTRSLKIYPQCPACGCALNRGEGFYLGPWCLNYGVVVFGVVLPAIVLGVNQVIPRAAALTVAIAGCALLPLLLYRASWSWWLALYFFFLPQRLPANGGPADRDTED